MKRTNSALDRLHRNQHNELKSKHVRHSSHNTDNTHPDPAGLRIFYNHMSEFNGTFNADYNRSQSFKTKFSNKMHAIFHSKKKTSKK